MAMNQPFFFASADAAAVAFLAASSEIDVPIGMAYELGAAGFAGCEGCWAAAAVATSTSDGAAFRIDWSDMGPPSPPPRREVSAAAKGRIYGTKRVGSLVAPLRSGPPAAFRGMRARSA